MKRLLQLFTARTLMGSAFRIGLTAAFIWIILFGIPLPYMFEAPGAAVDISDMISVKDVKPPETKGKFYLTAVIYERANLFLCAWHKVYPSTTELTPYKPADNPMSNRERNDYMENQMESSKTAAKIAAFRALGYTIIVERSPVTIRGVLDRSKANKILKAGDIVLAVDGKPITIETEISKALEAHKDGSTPRLTISRNGKTLNLDVPMTTIDGKTKLWIIARSRIVKANLPREVTIKSDHIIGASAGLMFTLEIMRQVSGVELTGGNRIAGTGVINENGEVFPIQGVRFKVIAAEQEGAKYFFVPEENYDEAAKSAKSLKVISVKNLRDALDALKQLDQKATVDDLPKPTPSAVLKHFWIGSFLP